MPDPSPGSRALALACPAPLRDEARVLLAHGGGGRLMHRLIEQVFAEAFRCPELDLQHDGAVLPLAPGGRLAITTDSYVVQPLFFPGGDIGSLAVNGTVNDLAMCGARPRALAAGFILEEGLPTEVLRRVVASMQRAAAAVSVSIVTGDTKVVERGKGDGVFVTTTGVGIVADGIDLAPRRVRAGDAVLLSGDVGRHGVAVLAAREGLAFETTVESDCAPLVASAFALLDGGIEAHCLRDLTRGGLGSALVEIAETAGVGIEIAEAAVPVTEAVQAACEILGLDPYHLANEGRFIACVPGEQAAAALERLRAVEVSSQAVLIGHVTEATAPVVTVRTRYRGRRILEMLSGEQLPRIC
jgi:hydrogenase expression/formation protein HypE